MRRNRKLLNTQKKNWITSALILLGVLLVLSPNIASFIQRHSRFIQKLETREPIQAGLAFSSIQAISDPPSRIVIPHVSIDLHVTAAPLKNGYWETSEETASFGTGSAPPGARGNTVIFAHAKEGLFLPLKDVKLQDTVYVMTKNTWHAYVIQEMKEVFPRDTYVVEKTDDDRLTLFTCSGFFDTKRLVITARKSPA